MRGTRAKELRRINRFIGPRPSRIDSSRMIMKRWKTAYSTFGMKGLRNWRRMVVRAIAITAREIPQERI